MADPDTFDLFDYIDGRTYPETVIPVYLDHKAAYEAHKIEQEIARTISPDEVNRLVEKKNALIQAAQNSRLDFHMRGVPSDIVADVNTEVEGFTDEKVRRVHKLLLLHIVRIENAEGEAVSLPKDEDDVKRLLDKIPTEGATRLIDALNDLTLKAAYYESVEITPDFS